MPGTALAERAEPGFISSGGGRTERQEAAGRRSPVGAARERHKALVEKGRTAPPLKREIDGEEKGFLGILREGRKATAAHDISHFSTGLAVDNELSYVSSI